MTMAGCEIQNCVNNNGVIAFIVLFYFYLVYLFLFWYLPHAHDQYHKKCRSVLLEIDFYIDHPPAPAMT